ncbi:MAG: hypothetical protein E7320_03695 [Clostridiales bacterium]|nr:hypothetical protein [Clostridiales bacterium]
MKECISIARNFLDVVSAAKAELRTIGETYKGEALRSKSAEVLKGLQAEYLTTGQLIQKRIDEAEKRAAEEQKNLFNVPPSADFQYLTLPIVLDQDQLSILHERNSADPIFCKALNEYVQKNHPDSGAYFSCTAPGAKAECNSMKVVFNDLLRSSAPADMPSFDQIADDLYWGMETN